MSIIGSAAEKAALAEQLHTIRAYAPESICADLGVNGPDLPLRNAQGKLRDLDFLFPATPDFPTFATEGQFLGPHEVDYQSGRFIRRIPRGEGNEPGYCVKTPYGQQLAVASEVFQPVPRQFLGVTVLTLAAGTQLHLNNLWPSEKRGRIGAEFEALCEPMAQKAPHEFLPPAYYRPIAAVKAAVQTFQTAA